MFAEAGFGELVEFARTATTPQGAGRPHPRRRCSTPSPLVGDEATVRGRIDEYAAAGITEIGLVVPPLDLPTGAATLDALAPA